MTREQIEQAANDYAQTSESTTNRREVEITFNAFIAGAEFRQAGIDKAKGGIHE